MPKVLPGCEVGVPRLKDVLGRLKRFMERFTPYLPRVETAKNAALVVEGLLSDLPRKTAEPIAEFHGVEPRTIQKFVGESREHTRSRPQCRLRLRMAC